MFAAYVVYNLDDGHDLEMIGCSDTPQGAIDMLRERASTEEDSFDGDWDNGILNSSRITTSDTREYGYQHVPYVEAK
ncbi:hypothetical protein [Levilactobacillus enshiensis]|uniref:hypothetical protein n=1 Tax=Levilactobacillus enshiensis TaxID=2590213 RepID=UPI00117A5AE2|nr:hypothetical protein [Levilactobacillus enshiensis]